MKKMTTGEIYRMFKKADKDTMLRKTNIRAFAIKNNIDCILLQRNSVHKICLINLQAFMKAVNRNNFNKKYNMPRLRTKISAQNEWNAKHRKKIKHHIIDQICNSGKVFVYKNGRYNIINYDELEQELIKELKSRNKY